MNVRLGLKLGKRKRWSKNLFAALLFLLVAVLVLVRVGLGELIHHQPTGERHRWGVGNGMRNTRHAANGVEEVVDRCTTQVTLCHVADSRAAQAERHVGAIATCLLGRRALVW